MKDTWSVFDIIGPVMVGPSSSHTAGACKIGYMARHILGDIPDKATIKLHGSFGEVFEGHCTDTAIIGGLLGMIPSDENLPLAYEKAKELGMEIDMESVNLGSHLHPNTVQLTLEKNGISHTITGSSLGGGSVNIIEIDKIEILLNGSFSSLLIHFESDACPLKNILELLTALPQTLVRTETKDNKNLSLFHAEIREAEIDEEIFKKMAKMPGVQWASFVPHISHYHF
ncbi:MAG: L-serine ammonia-lyase, iron-sulfur-dependent subunit beta [Candidatus Peregrinibacteria bacterium]